MACILIYHAHTTESFVPSSGERFTTDLSQTVAFLGHELKTILERDYGIPVIHDDTIHDMLRSTAYQKARPTAQKRIQDNPEIKVVVDLHRDGVARSG
jgi:stage II sporulation protein P